MPWNFPLWQVFRAAAPAIAAGNTGLLKHASNVPGCAQAIGELFAAVDAPAGLFGVLVVPASRIVDVIADRRVRGVTLTRSDAAGRAVQSRLMNCGQSCIAAKRFTVVEAVADRFLSGVIERARVLRVGPPDEPASAIGPMARADLCNELHQQVRDALDQDAEYLTGRQIIEGPGLGLPTDRIDRGHARHARLPRGTVRSGGARLPGIG